MADKRRKINQGCENVKVTLTIDKRLLEKIDLYANEHFMSRSGMVSYSCNQIIVTDELKRLLKDLNFTLQAMFQAMVSNSDFDISEDDKKRLEQIEMTLKVLSGDYFNKL